MKEKAQNEWDKIACVEIRGGSRPIYFVELSRFSLFSWLCYGDVFEIGIGNESHVVDAGEEGDKRLGG